MMLLARCPGCKTNWRVGEDVDLPEGVALPLSQALLASVRVECPTGICEGRELAISALDLTAENPLVASSPQDSSGSPIKAGDTVRFRGEERVIEQTGCEKNPSGATTVRLEGLDEFVSEWSIDLVRSV